MILPGRTKRVLRESRWLVGQISSVNGMLSDGPYPPLPARWCGSASRLGLQVIVVGVSEAGIEMVRQLQLLVSDCPKWTGSVKASSSSFPRYMILHTGYDGIFHKVC